MKCGGVLQIRLVADVSVLYVCERDAGHTDVGEDMCMTDDVSWSSVPPPRVEARSA